MPDKKPRLRKTAPTIRERVETAQHSQGKNPRKLAKAAASVKKPLKKVSLPRNRFTSAVAKLLKRLFPRYFIDSWSEVRQVTWPTRRETWKLTGAVFVFAIIFGAMVAVVDKGLDAIFRNVVLK